MTRDEAIQILGVPHSATPDEIQDRFRELARAQHPDTGGTSDEMSELLEARRIALSAATSSALVPLDAVKELVRAVSSAALVREQRREDTQRVIREIRRHHTSRLRRAKNSAWFMTALSAGATLLTTQLLPKVERLTPEALPTSFALIAGVTAFIAWILSTRAEAISLALDELADHLDDKTSLVNVLHDIMPIEKLRQGWTRGELLESTRRWIDQLRRAGLPASGVIANAAAESRRLEGIPGLVQRIGASDFVKLIVAKGRETGVVEEQEEIIEGRLLMRFHLTYLTR